MKQLALKSFLIVFFWGFSALCFSQSLTAVTKAATSVTTNSAQLNASVNTGGVKGAYVFQYGKASSEELHTTITELTASSSTRTVSASISGLSPNTTYKFRVMVTISGGVVYGDDMSFTTLADGGVPSAITLDATNIQSTSATLQGSVNPNDLATTAYFEYGTTTSFGNTTSSKKLSAGNTSSTVALTVSGLSPNTTYYYRIRAFNDMGTKSGSTKSFTTLIDGGLPSASTLDATNIQSTSATLQGSVNPNDLATTAYFEYGTTTSFGNTTSSKKLSAGNTSSTVALTVSGLSPNTTYYYRIRAFNDMGTRSGSTKSFTTMSKSTSPFSDCPSPDQCGSTNYGPQIYEAAIWLYNKGILEGSNGMLLPDDKITRSQLAKLALYALYGGVSKVPSALITDYFPSMYLDLQDQSTYYYRAAKALLYLDYKDGVTPFDRNLSSFKPESNIERNLVLKVLCETFNIAPLTSGSSPFTDFTSNENCWGYAAKCYQLGVTATNKFNPYSYCTRGDAILFLYRILTGGNVTIPTPNNTENFATSDFFIPANYKPSTTASFQGIASGNFNYYDKDFFNIDGYMPLQFGVSYNSCITEFPREFYGVEPMGTAWSHTYNSYLYFTNGADGVIYIKQSDGSFLFYEKYSYEPLYKGNHNVLSQPQTNTFVLTTPQKTKYTFYRQTASSMYYMLTKIEDIHGTVKTIEYEQGVGSYLRVKKVSTLNRSLTFAYHSGTDLLKSVTDPTGRVVSFTYNADNILASLTDAKSQKTTFNYGTSLAEYGLLKTITLPRGNTVRNNYKQRKLTSTQTNSDTPTTVAISTNYANGKSTSEVTAPITNSKSLTTQFTMDGSGNITKAVDNQDTDVSITYGDSNNPSSPTKVVNNISGVTSTISYNAYGLPTSTRLSGGGVSTSSSMTYNDDNMIISSTDGNGNTTRYSYSGGALVSITDALGNVTRFTNNSYGSPTQITDPSGRQIDITYNSYGNMTRSTISALGISNSYVYDTVSRITKVVDGNGNANTYSYDNNDNMLFATDAMNNTIGYKYDENDNLTGITNAKGSVTSLTYDNDDLLIGQSFQGHNKSFTYYDSGALKTSTSPDGTTFSYTYDDSGRITDNDYASFSYNSRGQLVSISKDGKDIDYSYDGLGRTSSVEYDGKEVSYEYDNNGNITEITYPGGKSVTYTYDALNRIKTVTDWNGAKTTYSYNADGKIDYVQLPNNVRTAYSYDAGGRLIGMTTKRSNGSTIVGYGYTLDDNGNHLNVETNDVFDHAPILSSEDVTYSYNSDNRITKAGNVSFGFDGNGNTTSRSGRTMRYDKVNNLINVSGDFSATYTYDGLGQRRSATRDGVTTKYVLSGKNVVAETNSSGTVQHYYVYGPTGLISRISASGDTRYYVADVRGSIVAMTDASTSANLTHKYQYDEFGKVTSSEEEDINRFRYIGNKGVMYEADNLTFMRARYYDESIGRFLSEDPIWSTNLYPYCSNNPVMNVDPEGEKGIEILDGNLTSYPTEFPPINTNYKGSYDPTKYFKVRDINDLTTSIENEGLDDWFKDAVENANNPGSMSSTPSNPYASNLVGNNSNANVSKSNPIFIPTKTIATAFKWDSSQKFASVGKLAESFAKDGTSYIIKVYCPEGIVCDILSASSDWAVGKSIEGYGMLLDYFDIEGKLYKYVFYPIYNK